MPRTSRPDIESLSLESAEAGRGIMIDVLSSFSLSAFTFKLSPYPTNNLTYNTFYLFLPS